MAFKEFVSVAGTAGPAPDWFLKLFFDKPKTPNKPSRYPVISKELLDIGGFKSLLDMIYDEGYSYEDHETEMLSILKAYNLERLAQDFVKIELWDESLREYQEAVAHYERELEREAQIQWIIFYTKMVQESWDRSYKEFNKSEMVF